MIRFTQVLDLDIPKSESYLQFYFFEQFLTFGAESGKFGGTFIVDAGTIGGNTGTAKLMEREGDKFEMHSLLKNKMMPLTSTKSFQSESGMITP